MNEELELNTEFYVASNPTLNQRVKSITIDSFVLVALMCFCAFVFDITNIESTFLKAAVMCLIFLYEPILTSVDKTLGQKIAGIEVRKYDEEIHANDFRKLNMIEAIVRYALKLLLGLMSYFTLRSNKNGFAIHDYMVKSIVTYS